MKAYSVEDGIELNIPDDLKSELVDGDLIHYDGRTWLFFDTDYHLIAGIIDGSLPKPSKGCIM